LHLNIADDGHLTWFKHQQLQDRAEGQQTLINYTSASLHKQSRLNIYTLALNGSLIRNNLHIKLCGANSEARLNGFYAPSDKQLIDNHTLVDHAVPNCYSNELYKGIINDNAKAVFNGKILVRKDAQKTNAFQSNKNILLSDNAIVYTKPQLEIFADDVKCSHGATSGQLDDESLFYLQARGISKREAYKMLMLAFAEDITADIQSDELRNWLNRCIEEKIQ
jgi:Fe-S cluster assembly protein SufD